MKRNFTILGLCILAAVAGVVAVVLLSGGKGASTRPTPWSLIITQNGKVTLVAQPQGYSVPTVIGDNPKPSTNNAKPGGNPDIK
ncbi:MAG: hypothetical protein QOF48_3562 [Verrucomicrobiota bacterium]|jgi:hypothetical protein